MTKLTPMLASVGTEVPAGAGWVFEPKYDGIRILAFVAGGGARGKVTLVSRNGLTKTAQFPEIVDALGTLYRNVKRPFVLDGEIVAVEGDSPLRFQELQGRMHTSDAAAIESHRTGSPTALMAFDLLLDGRDSLVAEEWSERRERLVALFRGARSTPALRLSDVGDDGQQMLRRAHRLGWEGIIAKRRDAAYEVGRRSRAWVKLKIERRQEFVVGGWTEPRNSREHLGALLLGYYNDAGEFVYAGHTGTGFTRATLGDMGRRLLRLERKSSPFSTSPRTNAPAHWVRPDVVVEIKFNEWTSDGKLRQPVYLGTRDDKSAREVIHEPESMAKTPVRKGRKAAKTAAKTVAKTAAKRAAKKSARKKATSGATRGATKAATNTAKQPASRRSSTGGRVRARPARGASALLAAPRRGEMVVRDVASVVGQLSEIEASGGAGVLDLPGGALEVSNLDKVYFPTTGHTKGDVMRYYARVSRWLLPAIAGRPLVMKRYPGGVAGPAFYQQKAPAGVPDGVRVESVSDEGLTTQNRVIGGDLETLLYVAQLGAISIDPWHSRVGTIPYADYAIVDLDPGPRAAFGRVVTVALAIKAVLDRLRLHAVPKTSGASGMHIAIPLGPHVPNDGARMVAELIATLVVEREPRLATIERSVKARPAGAVYVDYLQNIRGKTVAGVYSVRARPRPTVSTPLTWDEVNDGLDPTAFTIDTVPARIRERGDLWARGMATPNSLDGVIGHG